MGFTTHLPGGNLRSACAQLHGARSTSSAWQVGGSTVEEKRPVDKSEPGSDDGHSSTFSAVKLALSLSLRVFDTERLALFPSVPSVDN